MSAAEVRFLADNQIVEMLVNLHPSDEAVAWLAAVIADPAKAEGVGELSRRYAANREGRVCVPRARHADSVSIDGTKFKQFFWSRRIPLREVGLMIGKSDGLGSTIAHKGSTSYWTADAIATELGLHVNEFLFHVGDEDERARLSVCV